MWFGAIAGAAELLKQPAEMRQTHYIGLTWRSNTTSSRPSTRPSHGRESFPRKKVTSMISRPTAVRRFRPLKRRAGGFPVVACAAAVKGHNG